MKPIKITRKKAIEWTDEEEVWTKDSILEIFDNEDDLVWHLMKEIERLEGIIKDKLGID